MTRELKKLFRQANKTIEKAEKALKKLSKKEKEYIANDVLVVSEMAEKEDTSHPFADDVLMGGD